MESTSYRVDGRMIPPVLVAMAAGVVLVILEIKGGKGPLIALILAPFYYLGAELLARKIVLDDAGITVHKFLRSVRLDWSELESLDAVKTGSKLFLVLQGQRGRPIFITNTIARFKDLANRLASLIPRGRISDFASDALNDPPVKHGPLIQAWIVCLLMVGLVVGKLLGY